MTNTIRKIVRHGLILACLVSANAIQGSPASIMAKLESGKGFVAVLNDPTATLSIGLVQTSELNVYLHLSASDNLSLVRSRLDSLGYLGTRIFVDKDKNNRMPLAENFMDAVVSEGTPSLSDSEISRVLRPGGKAILGTREFVKAALPGADDWSHPNHAPDNARFSNDSAAKGPYLTKFLTRPYNGPVPQVVTTAAGRLFKAYGHCAPHPQDEALLNTMICVNGYNGAWLWTRSITPGIMVYRNTMIATPDTLFFGDTAACLYISTATGALMDQFVPPIAGGTFWKWMGMEGSVIYALIGEREILDPTLKSGYNAVGGWNWSMLGSGFNDSTYRFGFGKTLIAFNPHDKKVLWTHTETEPIDSRAVCMRKGKIYIFRWGAYLACLNTTTGAELWRITPATAPETFALFGTYSEAQSAGGWKSQPYLFCNDNTVYVSDTRNSDGHIVALNADDGAKLWSGGNGGYQLILTERNAFAISGGNAQKYDARTGARQGSTYGISTWCTVSSGSPDGIFSRDELGTSRLDLNTFTPERPFPIRPGCVDGVTIGSGHLYWWPWVCACPLSLWGMMGAANAGSFVFEQQAVESERLERLASDLSRVAPFTESADDWPCYRKDVKGGAASEALIPSSVHRMWTFSPAADSVEPSAPVSAGGLTFFGGSNGVLYAYETETGTLKWKGLTGGAIRYPPTLWNGRAFAGSGDGWLYCFEAATGRQLWRFRGAPEERRINVFGKLLSPWPAAGNALVRDSVLYFAAGMTPYDGTHLYALNPVDGSIRWQNNTSGWNTVNDGQAVAVQGNLLLNKDLLYLAGGNAKSPAAYRISDGRWIDSIGTSRGTGQELYLYRDTAHVTGNTFYSTVNRSSFKTFMTSNSTKTLFWAEVFKVYNNSDVNEAMLPAWRSLPALTPLWQGPQSIYGVILCGNAVLGLNRNTLSAYRLDTGVRMWQQTLPGNVLPWGFAVDARGRILVSLRSGEVLCYGDGPLTDDSRTVREHFIPFGLSIRGPNPFHSTVRVAYSLGRSTHATLTIVDMRGRVVRKLSDSRKNAGRHIATWDGRDDSGRPMASGLYTCLFRSVEFLQSRPLVLIK